MGHRPPPPRPVNTLFQSYALLPHLSVAETITFGLGLTASVFFVYLYLSIVLLIGLSFNENRLATIW